ncbi:hypothetical protein A3J77_01525 [Candidatus Wolfebacteria bacterium RBG_13_41_7]|uniref:Uncharacterized protein n=1 Tax=Candidatus Wolfebacteria bacterium RBG_13_41_7 TaxID=1802554 RepID=A0A1F8DLJ4_9BACT|nr:MAG: hypothetical protein A3J77_01525 [Candidatus Wolfebacteria bacterium RBG_13_41_7]
MIKNQNLNLKNQNDNSKFKNSINELMLVHETPQPKIKWSKLFEKSVSQAERAWFRRRRRARPRASAPTSLGSEIASFQE